MTSPLSPRDSEGWLIRRHTLGTNLEFAQIKGFKINLDPDNPSIDVLVIPAKNGNGLFGHEDIHTLLDLHQEGREPLFFSLDPPSEMEHYHPFQQFRYAPNKIQNTSLLHTMFETDYLMKSFSVGTEVSSKPPFKQRPCNEGLLKGLPSSLVEALKPVGERPGGYRGNVHRFWIEADEFTYCQESNRSEVTFRLSDVKMSVRNHPLIIGPDGKLIDTKHNDNPDSAESRFAADMTEAYDELSLHFPMFGRLRELAKLQFIGIVMASILITSKKDKDNPQVPDELLHEIQRDARTDHRNRVERVLSDIKGQVGIWPSANDQSKISSVVDQLYRDTLKENNISPFEVDSSTEKQLKNKLLDAVKKKFRASDKNTVTQIADVFRSITNGKVSMKTLEGNVQRWLEEASGTLSFFSMLRAWTLSRSAESILIDCVCSAFDPPSREDVRKMVKEHHLKRYNSITGLLHRLKSTPNTYNASACNWVPAATYIEETKDTYSLCYGGVTLNPKVKEGNVQLLSCEVQKVRVHSALHHTSTRSLYTGSCAPSVTIITTTEQNLKSSFRNSFTSSAIKNVSKRNKPGSNKTSMSSGGAEGEKPTKKSQGGHRKEGQKSKRQGNHKQSKSGAGDRGEQSGGEGGEQDGGSEGGGEGEQGGSGGGRKRTQNDSFDTDSDSDGNDGEEENPISNSAIASLLIRLYERSKKGLSAIHTKDEGSQYSGNWWMMTVLMITGLLIGINQVDKSNGKDKPKKYLKEKKLPKPEQYFQPIDKTTPCGGTESISIAPNKPVTSKTTHVVYMIYCAKTGKKYIGMTKRSLEKRMSEHLRKVRDGDERSLVAKHFNSEGISINDFKVTVLKAFEPGKTKEEEKQVRKEMKKFEKEKILEINTKYSKENPDGMNLIL